MSRVPATASVEGHQFNGAPFPARGEGDKTLFTLSQRGRGYTDGVLCHVSTTRHSHL